MSDHKSTLVPLATGWFQSPDLFINGQRADIGLFAESLIYYDSVCVHVDNPEQFACFISLLVQQGLTYEMLVELVESGAVRFLDTVWVAPYMGLGRHDMVSSLWVFQEEAMNQPGHFAKKYLEHEGLKESFSGLSGGTTELFERFRIAAEATATTLNNEDVSAGIVDNAYDDLLNLDRHILHVETLVNALFKANNLKNPPPVRVRIREVDKNIDEVARNKDSFVIGRNSENDSYKIYEFEYNRDLILKLAQLNNTKTPLLRSLAALPLSGVGLANLMIRSAAKMDCDMFLADPISRTIGNKLYEISSDESRGSKLKVDDIVQELKLKIEFPGIRRLVNTRQIEFDKILEIRRKAGSFRKWIQSEADHDRDAIVAYHEEVARATGFAKIAKSTLNLFGLLAPVGFSIGVEAYFGCLLYTSPSPRD